MKPRPRKRWFSSCPLLLYHPLPLSLSLPHIPWHQLDSRGKQPGNRFLSYNTSFQPDLFCKWESESNFVQSPILYQNTPVPEDIKSHRKEKTVWKEDDLLSNPLGHLIGLKKLQFPGGTSICYSKFPLGCECEVGGMDLGPTLLLQLWNYLEEQYASLQRWPQGDRKHMF